MKELALHILDIAENGVNAGATEIEISVRKKESENELWISIEDNGSGMSEEVMKMAQDPFYTSRITRSVGLGLPLLRQHAEMAGGKMDIASEKGVGTRTSAVFVSNHPDLQPLGDLEGVFMILAMSYDELKWELSLQTERGSFRINTTEIKEELGLDKIYGVEIRDMLKRLIRNNMEEIRL